MSLKAETEGWETVRRPRLDRRTGFECRRIRDRKDHVSIEELGLNAEEYETGKTTPQSKDFRSDQDRGIWKVF